MASVEHDLETLAHAEVVVAGGGPGGMAAAVAAARAGADVLLVESSPYLGGNLNLPGLALLAARDDDFQPVIAGFMDEFVERLVAVGGASGHYPCPKHLSVCSIDPEMSRFIALEMLLESGARVLLHTQISDVIVEQQRLKALVVESKSGRRLITGNAFVDASGDADLVARAGGRFEKGDAQEGGLQPMTFTFRLGGVELAPLLEHLQHHPEDLNLYDSPPKPFPVEHLLHNETWVLTGLAGLAKKAKAAGDFPEDLGYVNITTLPRRGQIGINAARVFKVDGTNVWDLTRAEVEGRRKVMQIVRFFQNHVPGCENAVLLDMAPRIGVRETRRIVGFGRLTEQDILAQRRFPDAVAQGIYPIDVHAQDASPSRFVVLRKPYTIPYAALVSADVENVIVAGRAISCDRAAFGSLRVMSHAMAIGQAAGAAAALAQDAAGCFAEVNVARLQHLLQQQGAITGAPQSTA